VIAADQLPTQGGRNRFPARYRVMPELRMPVEIRSGALPRLPLPSQGNHPFEHAEAFRNSPMPVSETGNPR